MLHRKVVFSLFLKLLAVAYLIGVLLHLMDLMDLRLAFSKMNFIWEVWIVFLFVADALAAIGLWRGRVWGISIFLTVASLQLLAYTLFSHIFGQQTPLILFHAVSLFFFLLFQIARAPKIY